MERTITLYKSQENHVSLLTEILKKYSIAFDFSMLGTGKTYTSSYISKLDKFNFKHVIVICPLSVISKWTYMKEHYNVNIISCITYSSVRSTKGKQPAHGLLLREDTEEDKSFFLASKNYKELVSEGVLLVIDEIQNIKNENTQFKSCKELLSEIIGENLSIKNNSRVLLLSGSPIDKKEQVLNLFNLIGITKEKELVKYIPSIRKYELRGIREIISTLSILTNKKYYIEKEINDPNIDKYIEYTYQLFQNDFKDVISSSMAPISNGINLIKQNAFYSINEEDKINLSASIEKLTRYKNLELSSVKEMNYIQSTLMEIELAKLSTIKRIALEHLEMKNKKVVICLNYKNTIRTLSEDLKGYTPLLLTGETSLSQREKIIKLFQEPNNNFKLIIANLNVCSTGIDLDDKDGNFPRFCLVNPSYSTIAQYQLCHRFQRQDTKSDANIHFFYGKHACEMQVLTALSKKSKVLKETVNEQSKSGITFHCDLDYFIEDTKEELHENILPMIRN